MEIEAEDGQREVTFISHASEDKQFVKNLTDTLLRYGVRAWYDDYEIAIGDSIRDQINAGLRRSAFGVVVLSHHFFSKKWPKQELNALANILEQGRLLPVLHDISPAEVRAYDPLLSDIKALQVKGDVRNVVAPIAAKVLGATERDECGRRVYRARTLSVADIPLSASQSIEDTVFEDCVIQGIATLADLDDATRFDACVFNHPGVFSFMDSPFALVGVYGLTNVTFRRCRFKDIGFILSTSRAGEVGDIPVQPWKGIPPSLQ